MTNFIEIKIKRLSENFKDVSLPSYATDGSSGMDVRATVREEIIIPAGKVVLVPTDFSVEIPEGYEIQVRPRSGLAAIHNIGILNSPGTIDSDYRGEVKIAVINLGGKKYTVKRGDRIAQMVIKRVYQARLRVVEQLDETDRNSGGFGHTGR